MEILQQLLENFQQFLEIFQEFLRNTGFANATLGNLAMILIGIAFITLAIKKHYEPLLLVPIGMGIVVGNIPPVEGMSLSVYDTGGIVVADGQVVTEVETQNDEPVLTSGGDPQEQVKYNFGSVLSYIYFGVSQGIFPPLIFLGIGAMTDFSTMLSNPRLVLLGAAAQIGVFLTFLGALALGFRPEHAGAIGIIGGADGPTAIFLSAKLAPELLGAIAIAAYSYMALVPVIQPPIMKLLTSRAERRIRMPAPREVPKIERIVFPIAAFLICTMLAPGALVLIGMLFFGNLLKESCVTDRLAQSARTAMIDIVTILLGFSVGASTQAQTFLTSDSLSIFGLGALAFAIATAGGVLFAKFMNLFLTDKINPLVGAAGVSAVPDSARVVEMVGLEEDPNNHLLMHAMAPNVAGVLGSAVAAGVLWSVLTGSGAPAATGQSERADVQAPSADDISSRPFSRAVPQLSDTRPLLHGNHRQSRRSPMLTSRPLPYPGLRKIPEARYQRLLRPAPPPTCPLVTERHQTAKHFHHPSPTRGSVGAFPPSPYPGSSTLVTAYLSTPATIG